MIISVTELGVYKRCHRMWDYQYRQRIAPLRESPHFRIGRMVHRSLAEWTGEPGQRIEEIWANVLHDELEFYKTRYDEVVGARPSQAEIDEVMADAHLPYRMLTNYVNYWKQPLPDGFKLIEPEQTCIVRIPGTETGLEGTLDGFVIDERTGRIYVLERKTYSSHPRKEVLESNEQFVAYTWILRTLFPHYDIGGILYDGLWKREDPPRGRKIEDLFTRHLILKSDIELDNWETITREVAKEIEDGPRIYPNRLWQGCWDDAAYEPLCTAESKGEDFQYMLDTFYGTKEETKWFDEEVEV